jgi:hypothetical protein
MNNVNSAQSVTEKREKILKMDTLHGLLMTTAMDAMGDILVAEQ